jgi:mono/diheme cytochrome c family protein
MKYSIKKRSGLLLALVILISSCSGTEQNDQAKAENQETNGLSDFEMKHGIGPMSEVVSLEDIEMEKVDIGKEIFRTKCSACHKMDQDYVGPPLGDVLEKRTPTYVINMILNPVEMTKKHPEARKMLAQYMNQMTFQNVTQEEARAIVAYLATVQTEMEEGNESQQN